jgi:hydroxypyruvate reductase
LDIEIGGAKVVNIKGQLRSDILNVAMCAIDKAKPDAAVKHALGGIQIEGNIYLVAVGKAAWQMADAAVRYLDRPIEKGIVLTKYGHISGEIPGIICLEAGHPVPDENSVLGTQKILEMTGDLKETDTVLFLLSGGGSALFEKPLISLEDLKEITDRMLRSGMSITQMNTIRKRLSAV